MKVMLAIPALLALSVGCATGGPAECGEAECAQYCADHVDVPEAAEAPDAPTAAPASRTGPSGLNDFEDAIVGPILEDIRGGIRPWDDQSVGICKGQKECQQFLGLEPGELPAGEYMLQAVLKVPDAGDEGTWQVTLDTECTTTKETANGSSSSTNNYNKTYDVKYINAERGYRLAPLRTIESPSSYGRRECKYTLTYTHPEGPRTVEGSWIVPAE